MFFANLAISCNCNYMAINLSMQRKALTDQENLYIKDKDTSKNVK
jgi:hypothetical protein